MQISRRGFLKSAFISAGTLVLSGYGGGEQTSEAVQNDVRDNHEPAYLQLEREGRFAERVDEAYEHMRHCDLCPRLCGVNRLRGERGLCRARERVVVHSGQPHFGEETPLVGRGGSGTVFFSNCNLRCVFCQNWPIAHEGRGRELTDEELANAMLRLQEIGVHNINVVTPTHVMPHILSATRIAMKRGLRLPLCYNTGGYERAEMIELLDGIVDIYLPDFKFMDGDNAERYLRSARDYPEVASEAILEMHRQVGVMDAGADGRAIARRGVMIRHLVMPNNVARTDKVIDWIADNLPLSTYVNIMAQYRVEHRAFEYPRINRAITGEEFVSAVERALDAGFTNLDRRSLSQLEIYRRRS